MALGRRTNEHSDAPHKYKLDDKSSFVMQESYKTIRTNLQFALAGSKQILYYIFIIPAEGKVLHVPILQLLWHRMQTEYCN